MLLIFWVIFVIFSQCRDVRILVYLLTGHNTVSRHLTLMKMTNDSVSPLSEEDNKISLNIFLLDVALQ